MDEVPEMARSMEDFKVSAQAERVGFRSLVCFPPHMTLKVAAALGLCIFSHATMEYPLISDWMNDTWRQGKVSSVVDYLRGNASGDGSHNGNPEFWKGLATCVLGITAEVCRLHGLPVPQQDLTLNCNDLVLRLICYHFGINLLLLKAKGEQLTLDLIRNEGETGLILPVAEEDGAVLYLNHQLMWDSDLGTRVGFPFFLQAQDQLPELEGFQPIFSQNVLTIDSASRIIESALSLIQQIAPKSALPSHLIAQLQAYQLALASRNLPCPGSLLRLLQPSGAHTILQCSMYQGDLYLLPECGHSFHLPCLSAHLESTQVAQCSACSAPLSSEVLALLYPRGASIQAEFVLLQCVMCGGGVDFRQSLQHDYGESPHLLCLWCLEHQSICPLCHFPLTLASTLWVEQAISLLRR